MTDTTTSLRNDISQDSAPWLDLWVEEQLKEGPVLYDDIEAVVSSVNLLAKYDFAYFRTLMRPRMLTNWWTNEIAAALQKFYRDLLAGKRPKLAIGAPPQSGKSWAATDFIAWVSGQNPAFKTIFASYSDELGTRTNLDLQRMMLSPQYYGTFPRTRIGQQGWQLNTNSFACMA
jgi:hypothetical protein